MKFCNEQLIDIFKNTFNESLISYKNINSNINLDSLHEVIDINEINDFRLYVFSQLNKLNYCEIFKKYIYDDLIPIIGPDILIQNKLNLSIQLPNDEASVLPIHSDAWAGDSSFQLNLWMPLTNCFSSNSMFLFSLDKTKLALNELYNNIHSSKDLLTKYINPDDFLKLKYGEFIFFNPSLLHGNIINKTNKTRISLNLRFKSISSPGSSLNIKSRDDLAYYKIFHLSDWYQQCIELDELNLC